ncbi:hypothetical protein Ndes2526B_g04704 [Nannochloris sp. 'desiccata']|nr:hypothetical protein KSW81_000574 [Chlorella desiccata (nom. nud.)]KAH7615702.1 putative Protein-tyrosine-phosphatase IBR5 [Chlorella desiccata (nom. nud.)]KAH7620781.1 putative Protein-tyrosine-phosphatase IBR5 [Chlorella desiccata (nom. nud.)]
MLESADIHTPSALPTEVIPGFLFIGSFDHASRADLLKTLGITHILNTVPTCPCLYKNSFTYYETSSSNPPSFEECAAFLDPIQAAGAKVLIHCMSGNSRSPSIALFYLMRTYQQTLEQSYTYLKAKRPSISFNEKDACRTMEVERHILGARASRFQLPTGKIQNTIGGGGGATAGGGATGMCASFASFIHQQQPQQQQQQQHSAMPMDPSSTNGSGGGGFGGRLPPPGQGFTFGAPRQ